MVLPTFQPVALPRGVWVVRSPAADVVVGEAVTTHQGLLLLHPEQRTDLGKVNVEKTLLTPCNPDGVWWLAGLIGFTWPRCPD